MTVPKPTKGVTKAQYPKFFAMCRKAAINLDLLTKEEVESYRHRVMQEEAGCDSLKQLNRSADFDACIKRFAADAGDFAEAIDIDIMEMRRKAYVVKVLAMQILQLKGLSETDAQCYIAGVLDQARIRCGSSGGNFWLDVSPRSLQNVLQILDTFRRKLLKELFPSSPVKFDDTVRYQIDGPIHIRVTGIDKCFYSSYPLYVNVR